MNAAQEFQTSEALTFDNRFTGELPADPESGNARRQVTQACYSRIQPTQVSQPQLVAHAWEDAQELGLSPAFCESDAFLQIFFDLVRNFISPKFIQILAMPCGKFCAHFQPIGLNEIERS